METIQFDPSPEAKKARTDTLLAYWRDHKHEWRMLHGFICLDHCFSGPGYWSCADHKVVRALFDGVRIGARMDEITRQQFAPKSGGAENDNT